MIQITFSDIYLFLYTFVFLPLFSLNGCCPNLYANAPRILTRDEHKTNYDLGEQFKDYVYAVDGNDGIYTNSITKKKEKYKATLEREGSVNTNIPGKYVINYTATNASYTQLRKEDPEDKTLPRDCVDDGPVFKKTLIKSIIYTVGGEATTYDCGLSRDFDTDPPSLYPSDDQTFPNCLRKKDTCYRTRADGKTLCDVNCVDITIDGQTAYTCDQVWFSASENSGRSLSEYPKHIHNYVDNNRSYINTDSALPNHNYLFIREDKEKLEKDPFTELTNIVNEIEEILSTVLTTSNFFNRKSFTINDVIKTYNKYFPDEKFD